MLTLLLAAMLNAAPPSAIEQLERLEVLLRGTWEDKEAGVRVNYESVANASTVVETYTAIRAGRKISLTVFHADGEHLIATHYCGRNNQPRLRLAWSTPKTLAFDFWDATNLESPGAAHLRHLEFSFTDADHIVRREVYVEKGKDDASELTLVRVKP